VIIQLNFNSELTFSLAANAYKLP